MGNRGKRVLLWLDENFEKIFCCFGLLLSVLSIVWQVAYRYLLTRFTVSGTGAVWAEEMARFAFVWFTYLCVPIAIKKGKMIRVDGLFKSLPARLQKLLWVTMDVLLLITSLILLYYGAGQVLRMIRMPTKTPAMLIPYYLPYAILPFSFTMIVVRIIQTGVNHVKECGIKDALIGIGCAAVLFFPYFLDLNISAPVCLFGYFLILILLSFPIAFSLGLSAILTILVAGTLPLSYIGSISFTALDNSTYLAIPFFIAGGVFMGIGGLTSRLIDLADEILGDVYGGIALASVLVCMVFAAMSGSGPATVAAIGTMTIPAMIARGYDRNYAGAIVACAGAIGVLIPPSNPFVIYAITAPASVGKMFMGGIVPGVMIGGVLMAASYFIAWKNNWKGEKRQRSVRKFARLVWDAKWAFLVPIVVLGGIYLGLLTPTESAALAAFLGLVIGVFAYREINSKNIGSCLIEAVLSSCTVCLLLGMATMFGNILAMEQIPVKIANTIISITTNKVVILILVNLLLLFVGMIMNASAAIVILVPILLPIIKAVGVDPVHFGVIMVLNLSIGFVTPPVGVNLFVASGLTETGIEKVSKAALPLIAVMLFILVVVTFVPGISLWLPSMMK
ncbi:TRAP transporter large permease subunit [Enterocloster bolteae]|uniref:TRAP transporter large permease n=1 Tax=Enterocloster bolteae TaxID=208479 RepID=UPI00210DEC3D|nr:TRAP transporter large permease subunit [Enterocloster bolteae]MCQ5146051.1 TRAP transporter large permease subunit [Enterocloster bolteae]